MRRSWIAVSVCGLVAILAASLWAKQAAQRGLADRFKQLDKIGDGFVTLEKARAFYAGRRRRS